MDYIAVRSSNIAAIAYDPVHMILGVQFRTGREYWYHRVPVAVFERMLGAPSKGHYLAAFVKPVYRCTRAG